MEKPRPLLVKLNYANDVVDILAKPCHSLAAKGISIRPDLPYKKQQHKGSVRKTKNMYRASNKLKPSVSANPLSNFTSITQPIASSYAARIHVVQRPAHNCNNAFGSSPCNGSLDSLHSSYRKIDLVEWFNWPTKQIHCKKNEDNVPIKDCIHLGDLEFSAKKVHPRQPLLPTPNYTSIHKAITVLPKPSAFAKISASSKPQEERHTESVLKMDHRPLIHYSNDASAFCSSQCNGGAVSSLHSPCDNIGVGLPTSNIYPQKDKKLALVKKTRPKPPLHTTPSTCKANTKSKNASSISQEERHAESALRKKPNKYQCTTTGTSNEQILSTTSSDIQSRHNPCHTCAADRKPRHCKKPNPHVHSKAPPNCALVHQPFKQHPQKITRESRKIWGTHRRTTIKSVVNVLNSLITPNTYSVTRKSEAPSTKCPAGKWWFVIEADKNVISHLMNSWSSISAKYGWSIQSTQKSS